MLDVKKAMEKIDDLSQHFLFIKTYAAPQQTAQFIKDFLDSASFSVVKNA